MSATDTLVRSAIDRAKPLLDRFGIIAAPIRGMLSTRRAITIDRPIEAVRAFLGDQAHGQILFAGPAELDARSAGSSGPFVWRLGRGQASASRGQASATLRPGPNGSTEVLMDVRLDKPFEGARHRYADNAAVIAARALHRAKSRMETGEVPTLAANPAARPEPDPYWD